MKIIRTLGVLIILLGVVGIGIGGAFVGLGLAKSHQISEAMRVEHVTLGIDTKVFQGQVIDTMAEAEQAVAILQEHRRGIAPTYAQLLGGGRFNPADTTQLTYAQALNLEEYLYLAVIAFGLTQSVAATGGFMVIVGLALGGTGFALYKLSKKVA